MNTDLAAMWQKVQATLGTSGMSISREMATRQVADYLTTKGFRVFEHSFPDQAGFLRRLVQNHDWLSKAALYGVAMLLNATVLKSASPAWNSGIADVLTNLERIIGTSTSLDARQGTFEALGKKVLLMAPDAMIEFATWSSTFDASKRQQVYTVLADKSPEEIAALVMLPEDGREKMIGFLASFTEPVEGTTASMAAAAEPSPLVVLFQGYNAKLRQKLDGAVAVDAEVVNQQGKE
jgi:hypothetical protein